MCGTRRQINLQTLVLTGLHFPFGVNAQRAGLLARRVPATLADVDLAGRYADNKAIFCLPSRSQSGAVTLVNGKADDTAGANATEEFAFKDAQGCIFFYCQGFNCKNSTACVGTVNIGAISCRQLA